jgi:hypothetical protein
MAPSDAWYESEESTRDAMIAELQRIKRRFLARPVPVLVLASLLTATITYKVATRAQPVEAEIVLALTEGTMSRDKHTGIPVDDLRQYVDGVLITDAKLTELIERRNLYPLRNKLGMEYAIEELRSQMEIEIWKNSFVYYDEDAARSEHSARIGITVSDIDPDRAFIIARDIAAIVITTAQEQRLQLNTKLAQDIAATREGLTKRLEKLTRQAAEKQAALVHAHEQHEEGLAQALDLEIAELDHEQKSAEKELDDIAVSRDALADRIAAAGLDTSISIVEEHRPERPEHRGFLIAMIGVVIGVGSLLGSALLIGAFDSRVHDTDDVGRLGLPVLGHVPGFAGDHVGSLRSRGVSRARVPSISRWRSHQ